MTTYHETATSIYIDDLPVSVDLKWEDDGDIEITEITVNEPALFVKYQCRVDSEFDKHSKYLMDRVVLNG
jgi:hypothetical protein